MEPGWDVVGRWLIEDVLDVTEGRAVLANVELFTNSLVVELAINEELLTEVVAIVMTFIDAVVAAGGGGGDGVVVGCGSGGWFVNVVVVVVGLVVAAAAEEVVGRPV